jgi:plasmid stabilization system protein ParE
MKVNWDSIALEDLASIKIYLRENWGETVAEKFLAMVESKISILVQQPEFGRPSSKYPDVRKVLVGKRQMMYYRLKENEIEIAAFFDQKMDISKNRFE